MKSLVLISLLAIFPVACLGSDFADSLQGSWRMTSGTVDGEEIPLLDDHPVTMTFEEERVGGVASCNGYGGTFDLSGSRITLNDLAMTEMACFPEETMRAESMFAEAVGRVDTVSIDGGLTLTGDGVELRFEPVEPVPDAELTNTVWVLDGLIVADSVSSAVMDVRATIEFFTDGSVIGDTGCRSFSGHYAVSGADVAITDLAADGDECEPDLATQDEQFISVVGDRLHVDIQGSRMTASSGDGKGLSFVAES